MSPDGPYRDPMSPPSPRPATWSCPSRAPSPRSARPGEVRAFGAATVGGELDGACRHHEAVAGGRSPLRSPDPPLEPEDEAFHLRRAERDLHHRSAADAAADRDVLLVR